MFLLHGSCLVSYVFFNLVFLITLSLQPHLTGNQLLVDQGIKNIAGTLTALSECAGFSLVLILMTPWTKGQMKRKEEFQSFLLDGFVNVIELKSAIYAQNPNISREEKELLEEEIGRFSSFLETTKMTQSIVGEMVTIDL